MSAVGFEPTRIAPPELESGALDRSAKLTVRTGAISELLDLDSCSFPKKQNLLRGGIEPPTSCV